MARELIWVESELVPKIELIQDIIKLKGEDISKAINKLVENTDVLKTDNIDTSLLEIKLHAAKVRNTYKELVDKEIEETNVLWEECDSRIYESRTKINQIKDTFSELSSSIKECSNSLDRWEMDKFSDAMDLIDRYNQYSDKEKELLKGLMKSE
ncbi:hypothetical protein [Konateibacter massiliensis]|uniref:hypothetical protein n=1 Tax=Konateibacter massiliensis TaxID=2002841 RepID=UPI000C14976E|nr:hypothetical protein [Konateibacter massiliensis]